MEPRARASRLKSHLNFAEDLRTLLYGAGVPVHPDITTPHPDSLTYLTHPSTLNRTNPPTPYVSLDSSTNTISQINAYPETIRVLDEIVTDFIIETSHAAASVSAYSGRAKIKLADFEYVMRRDRRKLGRVQEMFRRKRTIDEAKKPVAQAEGGAAGQGTRLGVKEMVDLGGVVGEEGTGKGRGRGKGPRRGRRKMREVEEGLLSSDPVDDGRGNTRGVSRGVEEEIGDVEADLDDLDELPEEMEVDEKPIVKRSRSDVAG